MIRCFVEGVIYIQKYALPVSVLVVIVIAAVLVLTNSNSNPAPSPSSTTTTLRSPSTATNSSYKNGTYEVTGEYTSPGGEREVGVSITLENGVVTSSEFEGRASDATSQRFQKEFSDNYQAMVVGKNIDELMLTKVSGSSLTPKGFNDALEKIKQQAKI